MSKDLAVVVPMLGRPHRVRPLLESLEATAPDARVIFGCSPGDTLVHREVDATGRQRLEVAWTGRGDYARKINYGYRACAERYIFLAADDLRFHPGWWEAALAVQEATGAGVVGTQDLCNPRVIAGEHSTHSLVTRAYADTFGTIDQPGAILHEGYQHEYVDDELVATARYRGAWAFAHDAVVQHLHPMCGGGRMDPLYAQQRQRMRLGAMLYKQRQRLWAG